MTQAMQTSFDIHRLRPLGTKILVKRGPVETNFGGNLARLVIPESARDRNELQGQLYTGTVIAVGPRTRAAKFGRAKGWFEPGDKIYFFNLYDWEDREIVLKDDESGDEYLVIDESDVKAFEIAEGVHA